MIRAGTGFSPRDNPREAGIQAAGEAVAISGPPAVTFLFTTDNYPPEAVLGAVKEVTGDTCLVGACVPGIIMGDRVWEKGVGACTLSGTSLRALSCMEENIGESPYLSGARAGEKLLAGGATGGTVFLFPDGLAANISDLLRGLYNTMGPGFQYIGGGTGDNLKFLRTYQFTELTVKSGALAAALVGGVGFNFSTGHGWKPIGAPMMITRAQGKRVYEIDGIPAFQRYSQALGGISREQFPYYGMKNPLGLPGLGGSFLVRDPIKVEGDDSLVFVTEVPQNTMVAVMEGELETLLETAGKVGEMAVSRQGPGVVLLFDCISRYLLMKGDFSREIEAVRGAIGEGTPMAGMLSFGEVSSFTGIPLFYNKAITVAAGG